MLLDDRTKAVEYFVENILAGTINVELMKLAKLVGVDHVRTENIKDLDGIVDVFLNWLNLRRNNPKSKEFINSTEQLFQVLVRSRLLGFVTGVFKEISVLENALIECKSDNTQLATLAKEQGRIIATYEAGMHTKK